LPYRGAEKTKGGIVLSEETQKKTQLATNCGYVLKTGALAYADRIKVPAMEPGARKVTGLFSDVTQVLASKSMVEKSEFSTTTKSLGLSTALKIFCTCKELP
jgi:hypothetical protein